MAASIWPGVRLPPPPVLSAQLGNVLDLIGFPDVFSGLPPLPAELQFPLAPRAEVALRTAELWRAYRDRALHLGDADFVKIPRSLTTKEYAAVMDVRCPDDGSQEVEQVLPE